MGPLPLALDVDTFLRLNLKYSDAEEERLNGEPELDRRHKS